MATYPPIYAVIVINAGVILDATGGLTNYENLMLYTIMVRRDDGRGEPVAWLLCDTKDANAIISWLTLLKFLGLCAKDWIMDGDPGQRQAVEVVFGPVSFSSPQHVTHLRAHAQASRFFCVWHVLKDWWAKSGLLPKEQKVVVWEKLVVMVLKARLVDDFLELERDMLDLCGADWATYYTRQWKGCSKDWAACYRPHTDTPRTSMHVERWFRTLKYSWLSGMKNYRFHFPQCASYLHLHIPLYLPTYLPTHLPTYLATYLPTYLPTFPPTYPRTHLALALPMPGWTSCCKYWSKLPLIKCGGV